MSETVDWETLETYGEEVELKLNRNKDPFRISVWDGDEMVHEPIAALQKEEITWWAMGYVQAKRDHL